MKFITSCFCITVFLINPVHAGVVSLLGDKDCFGVPGATSCPAGSLFETDLGGTFFTDYRDASDPAFTDNWDVFGTVSYTHTYSLPTAITSSTLELKIAGIADFPDEPASYPVLYNGTQIGIISENFEPNAFQEVRIFDFSVSTALLTGSDTVQFTSLPGDGYIIDYSQLTINTVPEPFFGPTIGVALAALFAYRRRANC